MAAAQVQDQKRSRRQTRRIYHTLVLIGAGIVFILIATLVQPFAGTNLALTDRLFTTTPPSPNIVIVGIDDNTLDTYGRLADWPRSLHAHRCEQRVALSRHARSDSCRSVLHISKSQSVKKMEGKIIHKESQRHAVIRISSWPRKRHPDPSHRR